MCSSQKINSIHFKVKRFNEQVSISTSRVSEILDLLLNPSNFPIYIHCLDGCNITGLVVMCYRKIQNWSTAMIHTEFLRFSQDHVIIKEESQFLDNFNGPIIKREYFPSWVDVEGHEKIAFITEEEDMMDVTDDVESIITDREESWRGQQVSRLNNYSYFDLQGRLEPVQPESSHSMYVRALNVFPPSDY